MHAVDRTSYQFPIATVTSHHKLSTSIIYSYRGKRSEIHQGVRRAGPSGGIRAEPTLTFSSLCVLPVPRGYGSFLAMALFQPVLVSYLLTRICLFDKDLVIT